MNEKNKVENCRIEPKLKLINMDSVEVEQIEWLLYPFIPYGKVTIIRRSRGRQDNDGTSDYCKTGQRRADFSCYGYNDENKRKTK